MSGRRSDVVIAGGGLSGGLIALALRRLRPDIAVTLLEGGETLGGNHRWSWFASDLDEAGDALMARFRKAEWQGYDVAFPQLERRLSTPYCSLASFDFDAGLRRELAPETIRTRCVVEHCAPDGVILAGGESVPARTVIDCRGFTGSRHLGGGWQVFLGRHMRTSSPHGVRRPLIMDARVEQHGGYRFVYVLPVGADELFIEDTYYQDSARLDRSALSRRLDDYVAGQGWAGEPLSHEAGVLPVITSGNFRAYAQQCQLGRVPQAGARALLAHPLTSYTLPQAAATAQLVADNADLPGDQLAALLASHAQHHWNQTAYFRLLGRMLFQAAEPAQRYRVFQRFYRLDEGLIERFYAARPTAADKLRVLTGRPPVPVGAAIAAIMGSGAPLEPGGNRNGG